MGIVDMNTVVTIQVNKRKKVQLPAMVVEAFNSRWIKVDIIDQDDHVFKLMWNGIFYEGTFIDMKISSTYNVLQDFSATKTREGSRRPAVKARRSNSGRPVSMQ
jgi:hypothetical protein